jgi:hypothetical protein
MSRNLIVLITCIIAIAIVLVAFFSLKWNDERQVILDRCTGYDANWLDMVDCYGVISIHWNDNGKYDLVNNVDRGWTVAEINSPTDFNLETGKIYLISITPPGLCAVASRGKYCAEFQVNGEPKELGYASADQVPTYLIIDTKTGDERFYANLNDVPEAERASFQRLANR